MASNKLLINERQTDLGGFMVGRLLPFRAKRQVGPLIISGETEMRIEENEYTAKAGDFYFINSMDGHGVRNATNEPCFYFAFKWK